MALQTNIPPQAYTRDTLVKAIEWMQTQPQSVRERAHSADLIVSYYLQGLRGTSAAQMEAPVSGENFKQDLRHLAQNLRQFEEPSAPPPRATPNRSLSYGHTPGQASGFELPDPIPQAPAPIVQPTPLHVAPEHTHAAPPPAPTPAAHGTTYKGVSWHVDPRSLAAAREIMDRLNLSNEGEALRLLVTFGMERARAMFP